MSATQTWILRSSLVLGMVAAVVTILYFTPMPEHHFKSCDRPCHELDWPMICRIKITLEQYQTLGSACEDCPRNSSQCENRNCVPADGVRRSVLTANRELPGPSIQVCQNDILLVDVVNRMPGREVTIHWRGQHQHGTPCMDGVPMVSQCPIASFTTFQYKFRASAAGTHAWHAHSGDQISDGLFGALVVRQPDMTEPQRKLYDVDDKRHVLILTQWPGRGASSVLINGRLDGGELQVLGGRRHRFRVAHVGGAGCPMRVSVEGHPVRVIALDGHPVAPFEVTTVTVGRGERADFVLRASRPRGMYALRVLSECEGVKPAGATVLYDGPPEESVEEPDGETTEGLRMFRSDVCNSALGQVCLSDVQSLFVMPAALRTDKVDTKLYLAVEQYGERQTASSDADPGRADSPRPSAVNNITFTYPSSPLLTQYDDISPTTFCSRDGRPDECGNSTTCECVHVEKIPLDNSVELILTNADGMEENVFHLHGYSFYVVGSRQFTERLTSDVVKTLDEKKSLFKRNLKSPALKDTIRIPRNSAVAVRFVANNPGYWMLRDEHATQWTRGLDVVLQVGSRRDLQYPPSDFPKCGNWVGPEFFLA